MLAQHGFMHGNNRFLKWGCIRVEEIHLLVSGSPFFSRIHCDGPFLSLDLIHEVKALIKNGSFFRGQTVQKSDISDQDIRDHLVHIVGIVFAYISMTVVCQSQFIIFCSVDDLGLEGRVHISKAHGSGRAS